MIEVIWQALYFFLPSYFSNMAPVLFGKFNIFPQPVHIQWFGTNKTWGGLVYGVTLGTVAFYVQQVLYSRGFVAFALVDYSQQTLLMGVLLAVGALLGDLIKSFVKRRVGRAPGSPWIPWDQIDLVFGGLIFVSFVYVPSWVVWVVLLVLTPIFHYVTNVIGYYLGLKKVKW